MLSCATWGIALGVCLSKMDKSWNDSCKCDSDCFSDTSIFSAAATTAILPYLVVLATPAAAVTEPPPSAQNPSLQVSYPMPLGSLDRLIASWFSAYRSPQRQPFWSTDSAHWGVAGLIIDVYACMDEHAHPSTSHQLQGRKERKRVTVRFYHRSKCVWVG